MIEDAHHNKPYPVTEMMKDNFFNFKDLSARQNFRIVKWTEIHNLSMESTSPNTVKSLYD